MEMACTNALRLMRPTGSVVIDRQAWHRAASAASAHALAVGLTAATQSS